jgi:hypothetical protein
MASHGANSGKREQAALLIASGKSVKDAADECGAGLRTVVRWNADPAFRQRVADLRGELFAVGLGRLASAITEAVDKLRELLAGGLEEKTQLAAAKAILSEATAMRASVELKGEYQDIRRRLDSIEAAAEAREARHKGDRNR